MLPQPYKETAAHYAVYTTVALWELHAQRDLNSIHPAGLGWPMLPQPYKETAAHYAVCTTVALWELHAHLWRVGACDYTLAWSGLVLLDNGHKIPAENDPLL